MINMYNCSFEVSEFELQSSYDIHFQMNILGEGTEPPYPPLVMDKIVSLLFFYKDDFSIK